MNPTGELDAPAPISQAIEALNGIQGYQPNQTDQSDFGKQFPQLKGQFLMDARGVVRWVNIEGADEGPAGIGKFPSDEILLEAARALMQ